MIDREKLAEIKRLVSSAPMVVLTGPRQIGKTTLAFQLAEDRQSLYLDLEDSEDLAKLSEPKLFLSDHLDKLVVLDEVQRAPGIFQALRGLIDRARREGKEGAVSPARFRLDRAFKAIQRKFGR